MRQRRRWQHQGSTANSSLCHKYHQIIIQQRQQHRDTDAYKQVMCGRVTVLLLEYRFRCHCSNISILDEMLRWQGDNKYLLRCFPHNLNCLLRDSVCLAAGWPEGRGPGSHCSQFLCGHVTRQLHQQQQRTAACSQHRRHDTAIQ